MNRQATLLITAIAPVIWGTTYLTATYALPSNHAYFNAMMRGVPAGLLLLFVYRALPRGVWWWRVSVLGALNIAFTFPLLFVGAYRLPGGVAATIGSVQPLIVALLGWPLLSLRPARRTIVAGMTGIAGVAMLVLGGHLRFDPLGILASGGAALATASGVVMVKRWGRPPGISVVAFTGWQLLAGGLMLALVAMPFEGAPAHISVLNASGYLYLGIGTIVAYALWFRGIGLLPAASVSFLGLLIPVVATIAGYVVYGQSLTAVQVAGMCTALASIVAAQRAPEDGIGPRPCTKAPSFGRGANRGRAYVAASEMRE